jgi:hypothetical protein
MIELGSCLVMADWEVCVGLGLKRRKVADKLCGDLTFEGLSFNARIGS